MNKKIAVLPSFLGFVLTSSYLSSQVVAQITPDNPLVTHLKKIDVQNIDSTITPTVIIRGGTTKGTNLLHSFSEFNIHKVNYFIT